jgi:predicted alpha/beta superfamily hydrolase
MLIQEIKPFIEAEYRTLPGPANTGLGGSSLGGLLTMNLGLTYPQIFGKLAVLSPSVWWDRRWIVSSAEKVHLDYRPRVWLDIGTGEGPRTLDDARKLREVLAQRGWQEGRDLHYEEIPGGQHNEEAWRQRVGPFLRFLFPAGEAAV